MTVRFPPGSMGSQRHPPACHTLAPTPDVDQVELESMEPEGGKPDRASRGTVFGDDRRMVREELRKESRS